MPTLEQGTSPAKINSPSYGENDLCGTPTLEQGTSPAKINSPSYGQGGD